MEEKSQGDTMTREPYIRKKETRKVKPISPLEIPSIRKAMIPDEVIEAANELIAYNWNKTGKRSHFKLKDLVERVLEKMPDMTDTKLYADKLLDIEYIFNDCGWKVKYDSESPASFTFEAKKKEPEHGYERDY
jgi:hypothetical protein